MEGWRAEIRLGFVANLARPGGNATGVNFFVGELVAKRLELLRELVPAAARVAVLVNPANAPNTEVTLRDVAAAARTTGVQIKVLNASTSREIEAAFAGFMHERPDALFVGAEPYFYGRRVQLAVLAASHRLPATYSQRHFAEAGGLMSYGTSIADAYRQIGIYAGRILKAPGLLTSRSCRRASSSWSSIFRPPGRSVSKFRRCCSRAPTR